MSALTDLLLPPRSSTMTDPVRLAIVTRLLDGYTIPQVAARIGVHRTDVEAVAGFAGHPNLTMLARAKEALTAAVAPAPKPVCVRDGCPRVQYGKGLCDPHYRAARRAA